MIKEYENIFTREECKKIIDECFLNLKKLLNTNPDSPRADFKYVYDRKVNGTVLEKDDSRIDWFIKRVAKTVGTDIKNLEYPRLKVNCEGGEYRSHYDFIILDKEYAKPHMKVGGQRIKSHLIYLNDDFEGGETVFDRWNIRVKPETGKIISWSNVKETEPLWSLNSLNYDSLHGGSSITKGDKYFILLFEKQNEFTGKTSEWFDRFPKT
jgi:hypothetical protein